MNTITVNDLPITCPFIVVSTDAHVLHIFDGTGYGDIAPDVATRSVVDVSVKDGYIVLTVR